MTRIANGFAGFAIPPWGRVAAMITASAVLSGAAGCKTDISQQLLERELRMQEDQIYLLQDELQDKCFRLDRIASENTSLKKQLGIVDPDASLPRNISLPPGVAAPARSPQIAPQMAPPALTLPEPVGVPPVGSGSAPSASDGPRFSPPASAAPPASIAPPALDGVPPLPALPGDRGAADPSVRRLSHEESLAVEGQISHIVVNPAKTECFDGNGDGVSDGLAIVFEPRDADERLVTAAGDVTIKAFDPAAADPAGGEGACIATWEIAAADALAHFRRTSRARGLHFTLPWQAAAPTADHVRIHVRLTTFDGKSFEADATVRAR
jgi:hypothetical protein